MAPLIAAGPSVSASVQSAASPSVALDVVFRFASDARYAIRHLDLGSRDIVLGERQAEDGTESGYAFPLSIRSSGPEGSTIEIGVLNLAATSKPALRGRLDRFVRDLRSALPRSSNDPT